jgi:RNA polymerase sigma factor (sigma-70 family)
MAPADSDKDLVSDYVAKGSESAFSALARRHVGLVYATALRQVADRGVAEEITQNVFLALARKAPRLGGMETLAGWLHKTTILEARARVRAEMRRARREDIAAQIARVDAEGTSLLDPAERLLDEGLLHLGEKERAALILRFWEERAFKEVGKALGVDEEAARKRVSRALHRLAQFFSRRGFQVAGAAGCATILGNTAQASVPSALAIAVAKPGVAAAPINGFFWKVMGLTKTQAAVACIALAATPLVLQERAHGRLARDTATVLQQANAAGERAREIEQQIAVTRPELARLRQERSNAAARIAQIAAARTAAQPPRIYHWNDSSPLARVPKTLLRKLAFGAIQDRHGTLSPEIKEALQLTPGEAEQTQAAIARFLQSYNSLRAQTMRRVEPTEKELKGRNPDDVRVFELPEIPFAAMREALFAELRDLLGADREELFRNAVGHWMPVAENGGMSSSWAVLNFGYRLRIKRPEDSGNIPYTIEVTSPSRASMSGAFRPGDVPDLYRPHIDDWIALAETNEQTTRKP